MTHSGRSDDEDSAHQDPASPSPNLQLLRFVGLGARSTDDDVLKDCLVHQDALHFGTDFP
jgi:hypothetical protein